MSVIFHTISGDKYSFIDEEDIRNAIDEAGRKKIILVEGYSDQIIYEILYEENLDGVAFIDVSVRSKITGGCEKVKEYLKKLVQNLRSEERYFGIIDRDFRTDAEVKSEKEKSEYNNKLYIFFELYTLENYLIEPPVLLKFMRDKSISRKKLIPMLDLGVDGIQTLINQIYQDLIFVAAGNWTLVNMGADFPRKKFLGKETPCDEEIVKKRVLQEFGVTSNQANQTAKIEEKYEELKSLLLSDKNNPQKYVGAKYLLFHFNKIIKQRTDPKGINLDIDNSIPHLARIVKSLGISGELIELREFIGF